MPISHGMNRIEHLVGMTKDKKIINASANWFVFNSFLELAEFES